MGITDNVLGGHGFRMTGSVEMASRSVPPLFREPFARTYSGRRRGMWVVLLGPDGAGKSSVINGIGDGVAAGFAGCDTYHLRPQLLGRRKTKQPNCNPHGKAPRSTPVTAVKLEGLLAANWLAHLLVVRPRISKGRLVVFDRYFADALVDPKRYRISSLSRWLVWLVAGLVPQPDLYVALDAPVQELLARKQEIPQHEAERQRREYRLLMKVLPNCVVVNATGSLAAVVDEVVGNIVDRRLGERAMAREAA